MRRPQFAPLRGWLDKHSHLLTRLSALGLVAGLATTFASAPLFFTAPDYVSLGQAVNEGPFASAGIPGQVTGTRSLGSWPLLWLIGKTAHLNHAAVVAWLSTLSVITAVVVAALLWRATRSTKAALAGGAAFAVTPLALPSTTAVSAAVVWQPLTIMVCMGCLGVLLTDQSAKLGAALTAIGFGGAFLFGPGALLGPLLLAAILALRNNDSRQSRVWRTVVPAYLAGVLFLALSDGLGLHSPYNWSDASLMVGETIAGAIVPGLVGGPWRWTGTADMTLADAPVFARWLAVEAVAVVFVLLAVRVPQARRNLAAFIGMVLAVSGYLVFIGTGQFALPVVGRTLLSLPLIGVSVAILVAAITYRFPALARSAKLRRHLVPTVAVASACLALSTIWSTVTFATIGRDNPTRSYIEGATSSLAKADPAVPVINQPVPAAVVSPLDAVGSQTGVVLAPVRRRPALADWTTSLQVVADDGSLRPGVVWGNTSLQKGPRAGCGWFIGGGQAQSIPLSANLEDGTYILELPYLVSAATSVELSAPGRTPVIATVDQGFGRLFVRLTGGLNSVTVKITNTDASMCTDDGVIGYLATQTPAPGPASGRRTGSAA